MHKSLVRIAGGCTDADSVPLVHGSVSNGSVRSLFPFQNIRKQDVTFCLLPRLEIMCMK
jgi:hypothetical protein